MNALDYTGDLFSPLFKPCPETKELGQAISVRVVTVLLTVSIIYNNLFMTGRGGRRKNGRRRRSRRRASAGGKGSLIHSCTSEVRSDSRVSLKCIRTPIQIF